MNSEETGICVIVAAYKAAKTIGRTVRTALAEPEVREVIVVDDASGDQTVDVALAEDDRTGRLSVIRLQANGGPARARNKALATARSPYVCVLDSDDYVLPGRFARLLASTPRAWDFLADDIIIVPEALAASRISLQHDTGQETETIHLDLGRFVSGNMSDARRPRGEMGFLKPIMSRTFLERNKLAYDEGLRLGEDYALYTRALLSGVRFAVVPACGYVAIAREDSISGRHSARDLECAVAFDERCLVGLEGSLPTEGREAIAAHRLQTLRKLHHRRAIDLKRSEGLAKAIRLLMQVPQSIPYIVRETLRAKLPFLGPGGDTSAHDVRLLLGLPGPRLSVARAGADAEAGTPG